MITRHFFIFIFSILSLSVWSQNSITGRVVDAETGEPLPYAQVYASDGRGCLANEEGDFVLVGGKADSIRVTFVGYVAQSLSTRSSLQEIRMQPCSRWLREVTVKPVNVKKLLAALSRRLEDEYRKHKEVQGYYFCRVLEQSDKINDLIDAILVARSTVNLRKAEVLTGKHSSMRMQGGKPSLAYMNLHRILEVGPAIHEADFWADIIAPLNRVLFPNLLRYYDCDYDILSQPNGDAMYRITMVRSALAKSKGVSVIEGTLYVGVSSGHLLRFEASMPSMQMTTIGNQGTFRVENVVSRINIDYRHTNGMTEVDHADMQIDGPKFHGQAFLFSLTGTELGDRGQGVAVRGNMLNATNEAGYDSLLWASAEVVKLTEREKQVVRLAQAGQKESDGQWNPALRKADISLSAFSPRYKLAERQEAFGRTIPQEKVYVHMDNTCYQLGDTIWFSAYTRRTDTDRPSDVSGVLYVELYSQDGYMLERKLIQMRKGHGQGFFALNKPTQYAGYYELRAYTRWQLNWGSYERPHSGSFGRTFDSEQQEREYYRDYEKLYSRVFPVYDRPEVPGDFSRDMTLRAMRRIYKNDSKERSLKVSLYPEGGNLVAGLPCRMAFEATWDDGEWAEGCLVYDGDTALVQNRGRGVLSLTPVNGMEREARFVASDGRAVAVPLPQIDHTGVSLRVMQDEARCMAQIAHTDDLPADSLAVSLMHEGRLLAAHGLEELEDEAGCSLYSMSDSLLEAPGVYQLTVFDEQGHVYADRLFFRWGQELMKPTLTITGLKTEYKPCEPVSLTLRSVEGRSNISLTVRDGDRSDCLYDNGNILTEMLLSSEIRGFVPHPGWYFEQDDQKHRAALDLLMMTQGWRRFDWKSMAVRDAWELSQPAEQSPILVCSTYNNSHWHDAITGTSDVNVGKNGSGTEYDITNPVGMFQSVNDISQSAHRPENTSYEEVNQKRALDKMEASSSRRKELKVYAELMLQGEEDDGIIYESVSRQSGFRLQLPPFYGQAALFLSVADTTRWKRNEFYNWIQQQAPNEEFWDLPLTERIRMGKKGLTDEATYLARICWPYPMHVKPYCYYQNHLAPRPAFGYFDNLLSDGTLMPEVTVKSTRSILRAFDDTWPVLLYDADVAQNMEADYGQDFAQIMVGNYGMNGTRSNIVGTEEAEPSFDVRYGYGKTRRDVLGLSIPEDSIYDRKYLMSGTFSLTRPTDVKGIGGMGADAHLQLSPGESREYRGNGVWDRYVLYSDYSPRMEGSPLYYGANMPKTKLVKYPFPDGSRRMTYRDRHYVLDGFAVPAEFYSPDYSKRVLDEGAADYRRTLYWNPDVRLNEMGEARISFYNNSRTTHMTVDAQGQTQDGALLWCR